MVKRVDLATGLKGCGTGSKFSALAHSSVCCLYTWPFAWMFVGIQAERHIIERWTTQNRQFAQKSECRGWEGGYRTVSRQGWRLRTPTDGFTACPFPAFPPPELGLR